MSSLFDFDLDLVDKAMNHDEAAFQLVCRSLATKLDQIERQIAKLCPRWPMEHLERVRDLFVHDRFLRIFTNPPEKKIDDFNALCWKLLWDSINDAYRYYRTAKRDVSKEQAGDATGYGEDGALSFWETHASQILASSAQSMAPASVKVEISDFMRHVNGHLNLMSDKKRRAIKMWMIGCSEREIAEALDLSTGNVGSIISRVISDLRKKLCKKSV